MFKNKKKLVYTNKSNRYRLVITFLLFSFCYFTLLMRLFLFQVMQDEKLINLTEKQDTKTIRLTSPRGTIFDKNQRALAISIKTPSIYIDPIMLDVSSEQIKKLKNILGITSSEWKAKTKDKSKRFVWLARKINPEIRHLINEMNIKGVGIIEEWDRLYPDREYASQVLGFVNLDGKGMEGVEKQYEQSLFSHAVELKSQKDAKGRPIFVGDNIDFERRKGFDVYLTIDSTLQYFLEDELTKAAQKNNVVSGFAIMMNPHTGQVLAMTSYPRMNPNRIDKSSAESRKNRNVLDTFEPGSTFKAFVMAQALEENIVKPDEILNCKEGTLWIAGRKIHNPVDKDWLTPEGIIKYSNNVCMAHIGMKLGQVGLRHVIDHFGFAQKTGIDFPYESAGIFDDTGTWRDMRIANLAFGQGISVTAIQMVRAMSVIANGGWLVQPYIVDSMVSGTGEQIDMSPRARRKKT
ncbi:MAG: penicillin-binding protein 2, partial [Bdellovibrionales bacterium]|nr:penicillin-binding protein 2 [Bdellovibrionales bacterium]